MGERWLGGVPQGLTEPSPEQTQDSYALQHPLSSPSSVPHPALTLLCPPALSQLSDLLASLMCSLNVLLPLGPTHFSLVSDPQLDQTAVVNSGWDNPLVAPIITEIK